MRKDGYNFSYSQDDYFNNRKRLNEIYVKSLIRKSGLINSSKVLDVGCGQGYFSYLFSIYGMNVLGIDLSETGINSARNNYVRNGLYFEVVNAFDLPESCKFDCVFTRSLSLYNTDNIDQIRNVTKHLMRHLKKHGVFIFCYNVNFNKKKQSVTWRPHTLDQIKLYFSEYREKEIYFCSKLDCLLFGRLAFNSLFSTINVAASSLLGLGGEIVCFIKNSGKVTD
jgi:2-polyprenyl-3-methyl-5-hydroxy-6-metoxy-1,4-benzoquinol methylase